MARFNSHSTDRRHVKFMINASAGNRTANRFAWNVRVSRTDSKPLVYYDAGGVVLRNKQEREQHFSMDANLTSQ